MALDWKKAVRRFWIWPITFGIPLVAVAVWAIISAQKGDLADGQGEAPDDLMAGYFSTPQPVVETAPDWLSAYPPAPMIGESPTRPGALPTMPPVEVADEVKDWLLAKAGIVDPPTSH